MTASNFDLIRHEWPDVLGAAARAESAARSDPRASCFYARRALELAVIWMYEHDPATKLPIVERYYQTRAIRRIGEAFEQDNERKALLVMATGAG